MVSTRCLKLSVLLVLLNAPLAQDIPKIALHVSTGQSQPMAVAQLCAVRMATLPAFLTPCGA